jgi:ArsR family transcriptional regulator, arsenate/arsenite/antimonite-responsive transcriptional repressor
MKLFLKIMKALSDPNRVKIMKMLQHKRLCVCEIRASLTLAQPTISKHLKILEEAGLVVYQKDGLWVNYALADGEGQPYAESMIEYVKNILNDDPEVERIMRRLPFINREEICKK